MAKEIQARTDQEVMSLSPSPEIGAIDNNLGPDMAETDEKNDGKEKDGIMDDEAMPDVDDPEAGFDPTDDQPYRRLRRHTIT